MRTNDFELVNGCFTHPFSSYERGSNDRLREKCII